MIPNFGRIRTSLIHFYIYTKHIVTLSCLYPVQQFWVASLNLQRRFGKSFFLLFSKVFNFLKSFRCNFNFEFKINECAKNSEILDLRGRPQITYRSRGEGGISDLLRSLVKIQGFVRFRVTKGGGGALKSPKIALRNLWTSPKLIFKCNFKKKYYLLFFDAQTLLLIFSDKFYLMILEKNLEIPKYLIFASQNQPIKTV